VQVHDNRSLIDQNFAQCAKFFGAADEVPNHSAVQQIPNSRHEALPSRFQDHIRNPGAQGGGQRTNALSLCTVNLFRPRRAFRRRALGRLASSMHCRRRSAASQRFIKTRNRQCELPATLPAAPLARIPAITTYAFSVVSHAFFRLPCGSDSSPYRSPTSSAGCANRDPGRFSRHRCGIGRQTRSGRSRAI
jgi:hypothetical protein